ncbi:telomere length regulation protein-domain-containing protein [Coniochaeta sp. 2T2.1]|nr:telomere length regulation protein-domain-containing protein [Coniochaeta sp. 2T2.1]
MDGLLTPVSTTRRKDSPLLQEVFSDSASIKKSTITGPAAPQHAPNSPEEALEILRQEPGYEALISTLRSLKDGRLEQGKFDLAKPSPIGSQIDHVLVTEIAPNYWTLLQEDSSGSGKKGGKRNGPSDLQLFIDCVRSLPGINAVLLRLRALTQEAKSEQKDVKRPDLQANLRITLALLEAVLEGTDCIQGLWISATLDVQDQAKRRPLAQEFLSLLGSGRVVSYTAEAEDILRLGTDKKRSESATWLSDGAEYSRWLGRNITRWVSKDVSPDGAKVCSDLLGRSLRLGYADALVGVLFEELLLGEAANPPAFGILLDALPGPDQRKVIFGVLKLLSDRHLDQLGSCESPDSAAIIAAAAGAIKAIVGTSGAKIAHLVSWLTASSGAGLGEGVGIRRAVMAIVAQRKETVISVLEKSLGQFGDQLYIKHSPILQQETHAQVLLLSAGYVHRLAPLKLTLMMRTSLWLNAVSNRLAASQERARFLGLLVGEALSGLVEKGDKQLDFHTEETNQEEGKWYKGLVQVADQPGSVEALKTKETKKAEPLPPNPAKQVNISQSSAARPTRQPPQGFVIEEVEDDESEDDDLIAYAKPDSDAEDSDDDATLVRRDKPKAPVYIRDLIRYLRDVDDYDHQKLALATAPELIRRKGNFGTEVKEHAAELASLLVGLQDKFEIDDFFQLRLQGMIALVVTQPQVMGQWFAKTFYDGDYSVSQRTSILAVLGISARELAGFETSEYTEASSFPSKKLPEKMENLYISSPSSNNHLPSSSSLKSLPPNALDNVAQSITKSLLAPIAAEAADQVTGPDVLKLSTFTSRLDQQQSGHVTKRGPPARPRVRAIPNTTAQLLYTFFFSPLAARFQAALRSSSSSSATRRALIFQQPHLMATYLRTLGIIAHVAGPGTLALPAMTADLWGVLLRARTVGGGDMGVVRAVLFGLLALLNVNEERMRDVCAEMGSEVVETLEWVSGVFEGTRGDDGGKGEEGEVKMLAAAVLIRLREGVEKYRALLVGDMIGF